jgi:hypothetical protein
MPEIAAKMRLHAGFFIGGYEAVEVGRQMVWIRYRRLQAFIGEMQS